MISILEIAIGIGAVIALLFGIWLFFLERRFRRLLYGKDAKSLEGTIAELVKSQRDIVEFRDSLEKYLKQVEKRLCRSIQATAVKRFNPFPGSGNGGDQSFSATFLTENGDGVIISSLYARDKTSIFSKQVTAFSSEYPLSEEEKETLRLATESLKIKNRGK